MSNAVSITGEVEFPNGETVTIHAYGTRENIYDRFHEVILISSMEEVMDFFDDTEFNDEDIELYE